MYPGSSRPTGAFIHPQTKAYFSSKGEGHSNACRHPPHIMRLTPIKVRGKGPRKAVFRPSERSKQLTRRGHAADVAAAESRKPAPIERLPTEILQRIFLFSAALNFPRASLRIGALLSPRSFRLELIILAFGPTWDVWFGVHSGNLVQSYYGWEDDLDRFGGDPKLQVSGKERLW